MNNSQRHSNAGPGPVAGDEASDEASDKEPAEKASKSAGGARARLVALAAILIALYIVGHITGLNSSMTVEAIRSNLSTAGWWGILLFVGVFTLGLLMQLPGIVFVAASVIAYGRLEGGIIALIGALIATSVSFWLVRSVGGRPLSRVEHPFIKRMMSKLDDHPIGAVIVLRLFTWMSPPMNYALALSRLRYRDYLAGSALGLAFPIALIACFVDFFIT